ncbi:MAG: HD domain-containing protein [Chloroflexi bacterium]|nr:HD domain-containing protein [Chloroflexota bacterium]
MSAESWALFEGLSAGDQAHALRVLAHVRALGNPSPEVEEAALLHDVGKTVAPLGLWWRTLAVLLRAAGLLGRVPSPDPARPTYPLHVLMHHAEHGARLCQEAGCSPRVVGLVRWHDTPPDLLPDHTLLEELKLIRAADDAS